VPVVPSARVRGRLVVLICLGGLLPALTCVYRFGALGGPLGGFENDEFVTLSEAQQVVLGDMPLPGWDQGQPLPVMLSAASLLTFGHPLFAEAVLTMGLLGLSCAARSW